MQRKIKKQIINAEEIREKLKDYELVKDIKTLRKFDKVRYLKKRSGELMGGGMIITGDFKDSYIVLQAFSKNKYGKPIRFSVNFNDVILFRRIENIDSI